MASGKASQPLVHALIVEDSEDDTLLLVNHIDEQGYRLQWRRVQSPEDLRDALENEIWDVVFSDFAMPRFSGADALAITREYDGDVPFIFISGTIGEETAVAAMKAGAQDYVMKDNLARLTPALDRELAEARGRRERRRVQQNLRKLSLVVEQAADSVFVTDRECRIEYVNPAFERLTGYRAEEVMGKTPEFLDSGLDDPLRYNAVWATVGEGGIFRGTLIGRRKTGGLIYEEKVITPLKDRNGKITHFVSTGRDITERRRFQAELRHWATHDALTGLPNRVLLVDRLQSQLERARPGARRVAAISLNLDHFKRINQGLGHAAGDQVLREVSDRLKNRMRAGSALARVGNDDFVVAVGDLQSTDPVLGALHRLREAFDIPLRVAGQDVFISVSAGIAISPDDGEDADTVLRNADAALRRAKARGPGEYQFYSPDINARGHELLALETDLRRAIEQQEFVLHYQPQLHLGSGRVLGVEALLRWHHPRHGLLAPGRFVPMLEETGLIVRVGGWVIQQACADWHAHFSAGAQPMRVAVNVSARQFADRRLIEQVRKVLKDGGIPPQCLELEITEDTLMQDIGQTKDILHACDALGVRLAVDDFGTGYSSMAYLKRFPIDALKIDQTFIRGVPGDTNDAAITEASIVLAHKLGLEVIAEGVENEAHMAFLRAHDCDVAQGFLVGRPAPIAEGGSNSAS